MTLMDPEPRFFELPGVIMLQFIIGRNQLTRGLRCAMTHCSLNQLRPSERQEMAIKSDRWSTFTLKLMIRAIAIGGLAAFVIPAAHARAARPGLASVIQIPSRRPLRIAPYSTHPSATKPHYACPPPTSTRASCLAIDVPKPAAERIVRPTLEGTGKGGGFSPADLASAYKFSSKGGAGQTIAIVDAYDDPDAESDLATYRSQYGLSSCSAANGCFKKVNQSGETKNYPEPSAGWSLEISLDLDMVSAACQECHILLIESTDAHVSNMDAAEAEAVALGATEVSDSWGSEERKGETEEDKYFKHPGIPITVASGDFGYGPEYPAASPYVIAVGGTALKKDPLSTRGWSEEAWRDAGSGCSAYESKPTWQKDASCAHRTVADVSAVAAPETAVSVSDSYEEPGWILVGGTSASAPIIAAIEALSSSTVRSQGAEAFYRAPSSLFDIAVGSNGNCSPPSSNEYLCTAEIGYDGPTGNGTPGLSHPGTPVVVDRASSANAYQVELRGSVNPEGSETKYLFEYGPTASYGEKIPPAEVSVGAGTTAVPVTKTAANLEAEHTYHYRIVASNKSGTTYGEDHTFATRGPKWASYPMYFTSIGSEGTEEGKLRAPMGLAVSPINGDIAVADSVNNRIQIFGENGKYIDQFGVEGTGNGQFNAPAGVAFDSKGNVWVADTGNNRIQELTEAGKFIRQFASEGSGNGQLKQPRGVALDAKGDVWVADTLNSRVEEFTETGVYVRQYATGLYPFALTVDTKGNVWNDSESDKVEEHNETGGLVRSFGEHGSQAGLMEKPKGLAVDSQGNVWVTDFEDSIGSTLSRVDVYSETGKYEEQFGSFGTGSGQFQYPFGIALDPRGNVWVADSGNDRIEEWKVASVWPPSYSTTFGSEGTGSGQFKFASGVSVNPLNGNVAVADTNNDRVQEFNASGEFIRKFGTEGSANGQFEEPYGATFDAKGDIWVADALNNRVQEFNEKGEFIRKFGTEGSANGQLKWPRAIAIDPKGDVWVADTFNNRAEEFTETGTYIRKFGAGTYPAGITVDSKGDVWTAGSSNRIEEHNETAELVRTFSGLGEENGQLWEPKGLAVDPNGDVYVADFNNSRVEVFSEKGEYLTQFGSFGTGSGQFQYPFGIALDPRGNVWVADSGNDRIEEWKE